MYDSIFTNLPHPVMCFPSFWFPPETLLFPKAQVVEDYLKSYSSHFNLLPHIQVNTSVVETKWTGKKWQVKTQQRRRDHNLANGISRGEPNSTQEGERELNLQIYQYDKLVIVNGHYHVPYFPPIPGLDSWRAAGRVTHSAWYRNPSTILNSHPHSTDSHINVTAKPKTPRRILVIGGGYSGIDIANELASVFPSIVHAAPGSESRQAPGEGGRRKNIEVRGRVVCLSDLGKDVTKSYVVYFDDGSLEWGIDHIVLATGYVLDFGFLKDLKRIVIISKTYGNFIRHFKFKYFQ